MLIYILMTVDFLCVQCVQNVLGGGGTDTQAQPVSAPRAVLQRHCDSERLRWSVVNITRGQCRGECV